MDPGALKDIFDSIDVDGDGEVTLVEYQKTLHEQPGLFKWFDILNNKQVSKSREEERML